MAKYTKAQQEYIDGVHETSGLSKNVFVNPDLCAPVLKEYGIDYFGEKTPFSLADAIEDKTSKMSPEQLKEFYTKLGASLAKDLNGQLKGIGDKVFDEISGAKDLKTRQEFINYILKVPGSIDGLTIKGEKVGIAVMPTRQYDTREEMITLRGSRFNPEVEKALIKNLTAISMKGVGGHEGGHLDGKRTAKDPLSKLTEEYSADSKQLASESPETLRQWRAYRALELGSNEHATSALILTGGPATQLHVNIAATLKDTLYQDALNGTDSISDARELLSEDPDTFFTNLNKSIDQKIAEATKAYEANPNSPEAIEGALKAQIYADYAHCFEDAYRRYGLEEDRPDIKPVKIIPESKLAQAYEVVKVKYEIEALAEKSLESALKKTDPLNDYNIGRSEKITDPATQLEGEELTKYLEYETESLKQLHSFITSLKDDPTNLEIAIAYDQAFVHHLNRHNLIADATGNYEQMLGLGPVIPQAEKDAFFKQKHAEENGLQKQELSENTQPSKVSVDFENRVVLFDGKPITDHFAHNADPSSAPVMPASDIDLASMDGHKTTSPDLNNGAFS